MLLGVNYAQVLFVDSPDVFALNLETVRKQFHVGDMEEKMRLRKRKSFELTRRRSDDSEGGRKPESRGQKVIYGIWKEIAELKQNMSTRSALVPQRST
ncbi:hypothetical protein L596_007936 [Steinernema carpocapsae]|uniref:Uncharacterized protein n=1 Tax=Steinernema carpocapsae TaxID=34508 RepID=A0A4U5PAW9_STECR|nr:hypothetical protein L596_007936 [Steinernema carpocapsae]